MYRTKYLVNINCLLRLVRGICPEHGLEQRDPAKPMW
jgi:hypothetical protein